MTDILVASGGGHLRQLLSLAPRLDLAGPPVWVTPDSGLAQGFLHEQHHVSIPNIPSRDWAGAMRGLPIARHILTECGATRIISTGAAPAPPFFLVGESMGLELHYIESATRCEGPSLSGHLVALLPKIHLYTQYPELAVGRWKYRGSIFDPYVPAARVTPAKLNRAVVTFGTEKFGFRRAVEKLLQVLPAGVEILWQTGATDVSGLGIRVHESVPGADLAQAIADADLVVSHAGTGSAITAFDAGKRPLMLAREARHGEHVDDHQFLTAHSLSDRGLVVARKVEYLTEDHLQECLNSVVLHDSAPHPFRLSSEAERVTAA